ncbi:hypothetical protein H6P81_003719 [Aristolochia fimbriata]|uniref:Integrase catalytic domain-containing protein n=1 Tax=Aristolochia fimbriata TaxID=158543 RepID=A0AAV7FGY5_ARIFI|nr:hypothetical protein H6P81_003719 [Aristolochia fimbriata]
MADTIKDGGSSTRPPLLEGTNYPYWKARMTAYIKNIDEDAWLTILEGWSRPTIVLEGKTLDKPQKNWTDEEKKSSNLNSKALNVIFCGVSLEEFSRMSAIAFAKEAWESLEIHYEGTTSVRIAKLQQLMTKFELIKMKDDETILEYDGKIRRLANEARLLGDPFSENRLRWKLRRIYLKRMTKILHSRVKLENKRIAKLSKGFNKLYKKFSKHGNPSKYGEKKPDKFTTEQRRVQCHGCDGYGHIQAECPTIQKKKKAHNIQMKIIVFFTGVQDDVPPLEIPEDNITLLKEGVILDTTNLEEVGERLFRDLKYSSRGFRRNHLNHKFVWVQKKGLKANLISISQLCDENLLVHFTSEKCLVADHQRNLVIEGVQTGDNCYKLIDKLQCYTASLDSADIWHQKLGHVHFRHIQKLIKHTAVKGLPEIKNIRDKHCGNCQRGKKHKTQHKSTTQINTTRLLELLHVDLIGPVRTPSHKGKRYIFVYVDDFSRFCWVDFLREKSDTFASFQRLCSKVIMEKGETIQKIMRLRSDHGKEFENKDFAEFCDKRGIHHEFSAPKTPQQNGVVERKNRTLQEMARVMLLSKGLPKKLWAEAINNACYITNRVFFRPFTHKIPYELYKEKKPTVSHFYNFGSKCYILCDREALGKFATRSDEGIFLGYSTNNRAYRVYNKRTRVIMESINVTVFDTQSQRTDEDFPPSQKQNDSIPEVISVSEEVPEPHSDENPIESPEADVNTSIQDKSGVTKKPSSKIQRNHPTEAIIGELNEGVKTRGININYRDMVRFVCYTSSQEPKKIEEALNDEYWVKAMQEELHQFERNKVWRLVPRPVHNNIIGTKWIFKNKTDAAGTIIRNKARLVAQGYTQVEGVDFEETFAPVAQLEAIRLMFSVACQLKIKLYQMDIKSAFLNGYISEEVFVEQPKGFIDPHNPDHVYKLSKALYGLKQAPRAWYDRLTSFLISHGYCRGIVDQTLFIKQIDGDMLMTQIYVDDMIFGATKRTLLNDFVQGMKQEFEMSMGNGIFLSPEKYTKEMVQKFGMEHTKPKATPMGTNEKLHSDSEEVGADQHLYRSMIGSLLYLASSRPDLCFSVEVCARYQANPKESHLQGVKRILRYVHGTTELGIFYSNSSTIALARYSDVDWAGNADDR